MGRLGLRRRKKLLIERSPCGLYGNGGKYERTFAERLRRWLGKWAKEMDCSHLGRGRLESHLQACCRSSAGGDVEDDEVLIAMPPIFPEIAAQCLLCPVSK